MKALGILNKKMNCMTIELFDFVGTILYTGIKKTKNLFFGALFSPISAAAGKQF
jgi:hypothetical protein